MKALQMDPVPASRTVETTSQRTTPQIRPQSAPASRAHGPEPAPSDVDSAFFRSVPPDPQAAAEEKERASSREKVAEDIEKELQQLTPHDLEVQYSEDDDRFVVTILDPENGDVVRQIPAQEVLAAQKRLDELRGLLFDEQS